MEDPIKITPDVDTSREVVTAFVVFEYCESKARCLEDYSRYSSFPYNLVRYPKQLKFKGRKLIVKSAPQPEDVVWENLEVGKWQKLVASIRTRSVTFLLVVLCFGIVLQAVLYQQKFTAFVPDVTLCDTEIPALYLDSYSSQISTMEMVRPPSITEEVALDKECSAIIPGSFYAKYAFHGVYNKPVGNYSIAACCRFPPIGVG